MFVFDIVFFNFGIHFGIQVEVFFWEFAPLRTVVVVRVSQHIGDLSLILRVIQSELRKDVDDFKHILWRAVRCGDGKLQELYQWQVATVCIKQAGDEL